MLRGWKGSTLATGLLVLAGCLGGGSDPATEPPPTDGGGPGANETLNVDFQFAPNNPRLGQLVRFSDRSSDSAFEIVSHAWDFGDGHGSTSRNVTHVYTEAGVKTVTLRVRNADNVQASAFHHVAVRANEADPNGTDLPPGDGAYLSFGAPVKVQDGGGGEPSVAIDDEGRIYVNPIRRLYRSDDEGRSFQQTAYPVTILSGDSHVVVDPDERVWISDLGGVTAPLLGSVNVWSSTTHGDSWSTGNPAASDTVLNDRQWLAASGGGKGYLLYRSCTVFVPPGSCLSLGSLMTRTIDGGLTWLPVGRAFQWTSFPFVDAADGTLYVVQSAGTAIDVATSDDGGLSWSQVRVADRASATDNLFVTGDVDDAGNVYVTWIDKDTDQYDVWMSYSTNKGANWIGPTRVSAGVGTNVMPWLAAGADGHVVVTWYGTGLVTNIDDAPDNAEWYVYAAHSGNAHDPKPTFLGARATGVVHLGAICTMGAACGSSDDRDLLDFFMVGLMPDGRAGIAYAEDGASETAKTMFVMQTGGPLSR